MSPKSRNFIKILVLASLVLLVFGFNFASIYCLAQPATNKVTATQKVDLTKPHQAKDDPNFTPITLPDENYKIPKPATRKEAVDDNVEANKQKLRDQKTDKIDVTLKILDLDYYKNNDEKAKYKNEFDINLKIVISKLNLKEGDYYVFESIPSISVSIDENQLEILKSIPEVLSVSVSREIKTSLLQSIPQISDVSLQSKQYGSGQGNFIAVVDSGIKKSHPDFGGRVVYEACYLNSVISAACATNSLRVDDGNGNNTNGGLNAGEPCGGYNCDHGTHVAGIAAGQNGTARQAKILSFMTFKGGVDANSDATTNTDALNRALDKIYTLQTDSTSQYYNKISSVNLSLGFGNYASNCDSSDTANGGMLPFITSLSNSKVRVVAASGNSSQTTGINYPSCLSSVVSVGSVSKQNVITSFSNSASILNLLAPGGEFPANQTSSAIFSSNSNYTPGNISTYTIGKIGTSMAAPHVAGAIVQLKSLFPNRTEQQYLDGLQLTGDVITDTRSGAGNLVKPRINMENAYNYLCQTPPQSGTWVVNNDCTIDKSVSYQSGQILVNNNVTLTVKNTGNLDFDSRNQNVIIKNGAKLFIQNGGKVY